MGHELNDSESEKEESYVPPKLDKSDSADPLETGIEQQQLITRYARCILNFGIVQAEEGWREQALDLDHIPFDWRKVGVLNPEAAQEVLPLDLPPGLSYQTVWSRRREAEDQRRANLNAGRAFLHGEPTYRNEYHCRDKYGREHWLQQVVTVHPLNENRWQIFGIATDVTELKQAEAAARASHEQMRLITRHARCILNFGVVEGREGWRECALDLNQPAFDWLNVEVQNPEAAQEVLPLDLGPDLSYQHAWYNSWNAESRLRADITARRALLYSEPIYRNEICCTDKFGRQHWLQEMVAVRPLDESHWQIFGIAMDISEMKQAEEALRASEEHMQLITRHTRCILNFGVVEASEGWREHALDPENTVFDWRNVEIINPEAAQEVLPLDLPPGKTYRQAWLNDRSIEDLHHANINAGRAFLHGHPMYRNEFRCADKHGHLHWLQQTVTVRPLDDNHWQVFGIAMDISEMKQAEEAARRAKEEWERTFDATPDMICLLDENHSIRRINRTMAKRLGLTPQEAIGKKCYELLHGTLEPPELCPHECLLRDQREHSAEYFEKKLDAWLHVRTSPLWDDEGRLFGAVHIAWNITDRKRHERLMAARLRMSEYSISHSVKELLQMALDEAEGLTGSLIGLCHFLDEDQNTLSSQAWSTRTREKMCAAPSASAHYPVSRAGVWVDCVRERRPVIHNDYPNLPHKTGLPEGHPPVVRELVVPVFRGEKIVAVFGVGNKAAPYDERDVSDISELAGMLWDLVVRKQAEERQRDMERRMQETQKLESLGVLAGGIAHDFNNLLTAILGHADLALQYLSPMSLARDSLQEIEKASFRAAELCRQMLAYSGKGRFVIEAISLMDMVEEMVHLLKSSISKKAILNLNMEKNLPPILGDATQIRQVVMNLVINASEAISDQSGVITISTGVMQCERGYLAETYLDENLPEGLYVYVEVSDTGCGMDRETMGRIFEPFFTTKFTGRGLGMSAVLGIVRGHKGALKIYSEPGKGTTFKVLFPASKEEASVAGQKDANGLEGWKGEGGILLVDDEEIVRNIAKRMLESMGFKVLIAEDGREAVNLYQDRAAEINLVLLDLTMPVMNGEEAFRELRRLDPHVRVIMSSGYTESEIASRFAGKGLAGFIQKPYRLAWLRERLQAILQAAGKEKVDG
ncbi:MAG: PAS domain S-box protein [Candidatus Sumerlaeota bacterium]|nr:PAS domain S-box protein [Candidatus Sumerlaeota bacterium]